MSKVTHAVNFHLHAEGGILLSNLSTNQVPANDLILNTFKKIKFSVLVFLDIWVVIITPQTQKLPGKSDYSQ